MNNSVINFGEAHASCGLFPGRPFRNESQCGILGGASTIDRRGSTGHGLLHSQWVFISPSVEPVKEGWKRTTVMDEMCFSLSRKCKYATLCTISLQNLRLGDEVTYIGNQCSDE